MNFIKETRADGSPLPDGRMLVSMIDYFKYWFKVPLEDITNMPKIESDFFNLDSAEKITCQNLTLGECLLLGILCQARYHGIKYVSISGQDLIAPKKIIRKSNHWRDDMFAWDVCSHYDINNGAGNGRGDHWAQYQIRYVFGSNLWGVWSANDEKLFANLKPFSLDTKIKTLEEFDTLVKEGRYEKYDPFK